MALEDINPSFRMDATVAPVWKCENYNIEDKTFEVYYNDGTLNNDEWYGPMPLDIDTMRAESEEPLHFQIESRVYTHIQMQKLAECNMDATKKVLSDMIGIEQKFSVMDLIKHQETMQNLESPSTSPVCNQTQIMNIYSEDDFDEQFEALSAELSED